ncbi:MAG TPA: hypothetical protein VN654_18700 [Vicinamibacterales bacterium]|nr:hypothetical protein [Vicinamibacterales bacterium]
MKRFISRALLGRAVRRVPDPAPGQQDLIKVLVAHHVSLVPTFFINYRGYPRDWAEFRAEAHEWYKDPNLQQYYPTEPRKRRSPPLTTSARVRCEGSRSTPKRRMAAGRFDLVVINPAPVDTVFSRGWGERDIEYGARGVNYKY